MLRAFDRWERSGQRRPTPAEIVILAEREIEPFKAELKRREPPPLKITDDRPRISPDRAAQIMAEAGFNPERAELFRRFPMARSEDEVRQRQAAAREIAARAAAMVTPEMLAEVRDRNSLVREARAAQAKAKGRAE